MQCGNGVDHCPPCKHFGLASKGISKPGLHVICSSSPGSYANLVGAIKPLSGSPK